MTGVSRRVQALASENDSLAGSLERGIRTHEIEVVSHFYI